MPLASFPLAEGQTPTGLNYASLLYDVWNAHVHDAGEGHALDHAELSARGALTHAQLEAQLAVYEAGYPVGAMASATEPLLWVCGLWRADGAPRAHIPLWIEPGIQKRAWAPITGFRYATAGGLVTPNHWCWIDFWNDSPHEVPIKRNSGARPWPLLLFAQPQWNALDDARRAHGGLIVRRASDTHPALQRAHDAFGFYVMAAFSDGFGNSWQGMLGSSAPSVAEAALPSIAWWAGFEAGQLNDASGIRPRPVPPRTQSVTDISFPIVAAARLHVPDTPTGTARLGSPRNLEVALSHNVAIATWEAPVGDAAFDGYALSVSGRSFHWRGLTNATTESVTVIVPFDRELLISVAARIAELEGPAQSILVGTAPAPSSGRPQPPTTFSASYSVHNGQPRLRPAWRAPGSGPTPGRYRVEWYVREADGTTRFAGAKTSTATNTYIDEGLAYSTEYEIRVYSVLLSAQNAPTQASDALTGTRLTEDVLPQNDVPPDLDDAQVLVATVSGTAHLRLTWTHASNPRNVPLSGYYVYVNDARLSTQLAATATSYTFTGLEAGRRYRVGVQPYNQNSDAPPSNRASQIAYKEATTLSPTTIYTDTDRALTAPWGANATLGFHRFPLGWMQFEATSSPRARMWGLIYNAPPSYQRNNTWQLWPRPMHEGFELWNTVRARHAAYFATFAGGTTSSRYSSATRNNMKTSDQIDDGWNAYRLWRNYGLVSQGGYRVTGSGAIRFTRANSSAPVIVYLRITQWLLEAIQGTLIFPSSIDDYDDWRTASIGGLNVKLFSHALPILALTRLHEALPLTGGNVEIPTDFRPSAGNSGQFSQSLHQGGASWRRRYHVLKLKEWSRGLERINDVPRRPSGPSWGPVSELQSTGVLPNDEAALPSSSRAMGTLSGEPRWTTSRLYLENLRYTPKAHYPGVDEDSLERGASASENAFVLQTHGGYFTTPTSPLTFLRQREETTDAREEADEFPVIREPLAVSRNENSYVNAFNAGDSAPRINLVSPYDYLASRLYVMRSANEELNQALWMSSGQAQLEICRWNV